MRLEIKTRWLEALRSGKYKQTCGTLHDDTGFCCLGVLCDLYRKEKKKKFWFKILPSPGYIFYSHKEKIGNVLPREVMEWAELKSFNPSLPDPRIRTFNTCLGVLNDDRKLSFEQLADEIEEHL